MARATGGDAGLGSNEGSGAAPLCGAGLIDGMMVTLRYANHAQSANRQGARFGLAGLPRQPTFRLERSRLVFSARKLLEHERIIF
jgi:hypothetical protein